MILLANFVVPCPRRSQAAGEQLLYAVFPLLFHMTLPIEDMEQDAITSMCLFCMVLHIIVIIIACVVLHSISHTE